MAERDPYLDPQTGIWRNKVGARTQEQLDLAQARLVPRRAQELLNNPVPPTGDLTELRSIHRHLFQDIYSWAGDLRKTESPTPTGDFFAAPDKIARYAGMAAADLHKDNDLRGMNRDQFIDGIAHHYAQFNFLHPFADGNGRAERAFWNRIAADAGWAIKWESALGLSHDLSLRSLDKTGDVRALRAMFNSIVEEARPHTAVQQISFKASARDITGKSARAAAQPAHRERRQPRQPNSLHLREH